MKGNAAWILSSDKSELPFIGPTYKIGVPQQDQYFFKLRIVIERWRNYLDAPYHIKHTIDLYSILFNWQNNTTKTNGGLIYYQRKGLTIVVKKMRRKSVHTFEPTKKKKKTIRPILFPMLCATQKILSNCLWHQTYND